MMLRAKTSFWADNRRNIGVGQTIDSEHPVAKANPDYFEPVQPDIRWEQTTAAPNELRHVVPAPAETTGEKIAREAEEEIEREQRLLNDQIERDRLTDEELKAETKDDGLPVVADVVKLFEPGDMNKGEVQTVARREGVPDWGTVAQIVERINNKRLGG